jgi:hypothetical protein
LLVGINGLVQTAPFFDERKLASWLQEMALRFGHAAAILLADHEGEDQALLQTRGHYLKCINDWKAKYLEKWGGRPP